MSYQRENLWSLAPVFHQIDTEDQCRQLNGACNCIIQEEIAAEQHTARGWLIRQSYKANILILIGNQV